MERTFSLGYSPCPNDTFIFFALAQKRIQLEGLRFDIHLADVEELNQKARKCELDVTKTSIYALEYLLNDYWLLRSGGAMGRGCGPLLVSSRSIRMEELSDRTIAIPGKMTTAFLLLQLHGGHKGKCVEMAFDRIMPAVADGNVDAGLIIHEGRFTYPLLGLHLVLDLGQWWENETGLPLPLGGILMKRELGSEAARLVEEKIRRSLLYAQDHTEEAWPYIQSLAQEMDPKVIQQHIDMFVNDYSLDIGADGERAIRSLLEASAAQQHKTLPPGALFWDE
jgi:1,4-dihydroxy-6-naphthoate synthase